MKLPSEKMSLDLTDDTLALAQAITWANVDPDLCFNMALSHADSTIGSVPWHSVKLQRYIESIISILEQMYYIQ